MAVVNEVSTVSHIPQFVPFGLLYYTQDTGDLYIGTGFSTGSDYVGGNPGPNVNVELISSPGGLPGGFNGDIQYNNNGNLGGSAATITAAGAINALSITATTATVTSTLELQTATIVDSLGSTGTVGQALESTGTGVKWAAVSSTETWAALTGAMTATQVAPWYNATSTIDSGISRLGAASLAIGNGTAGDQSGTLSATTVYARSQSSTFGYLSITAGSSNDSGVIGWYPKNSGARTAYIGFDGSDAGTSPTDLSLVVASGAFNVMASVLRIGAAGAYDLDAGISRLGAASLAIGNGTAGDTSGSLSLGGSNAASTGAIRLANATAIYARNAANNGDLRLLLTDSANNIYLGSGGNPGTASLTLAGSGSSMTFSGSALFSSNLQVQNSNSSLTMLLSNSTTGTSTTANSSQTLQFSADYYNGSASANDLWNIQSSLAAGTNGASTLNVTHTGSTGQASINLASSLELSWNADAGISRLGAASLAIGNGTASDTTGNLSFNKVIKYAGVATVSAGVPSELATVDLTAQSAAITATTLYSVPAAGAGMYRITWVAMITTAGTTSALGGTNGFQISFTSPTDSVVKTDSPTTPIISAANTTGTSISGCEVVYAKASTNIQYAFGYSSSGTTMVYELHCKCEYLG